MGRTIAVLGSGNGGQAMAAEMAMRGHEVRLYEHPSFASRALRNAMEARSIEVQGSVFAGTASIACWSTELGEVMRGAELVLLPVPAFAHVTYGELLPPLLEDGQILVLFPGTFGTLYLRERFRAAGVKKDVVLCETHTLPYDCRLEAPGCVRVLWKNTPMLVGVLPSRRTEETLARLGEDLYPFRAMTDVLEAGLCSVNPVLHLPACIMNTGRIERSRGEFWLYEEGFTPTVCRVTEAVDAERVALAKAYGYDVPSLVQELAEHQQPRDLFHEINGAHDLVVIKGPTSVKSRYFTEDIPFGLVPWTELGDEIGFDTPLLDALLALGGTIIEERPRETGRTLASLGIAGLDREALETVLRDG